MVDVDRFARHHPGDFQRARAEMEAGRKSSHWMWFVFPQFVGLGRSATAVEYGISGADEAEAYLRHPVLGRDYATIVAVVWDQVVRKHVGITALMGSPDDLKLVSSLTLFGAVARQTSDPRFATLADLCDDILSIAAEQGFPRCSVTTAALAR